MKGIGRRFILLVEGRNFPPNKIDCTASLLGFYATRFVEAINHVDAENQAMQMIRDEFRSAVRESTFQNTHPSLHLVEMREVESFPSEFANRGASWYEMDS